MLSAVIGIGSNSVRALMAEAAGNSLERRWRDREGTRLFAGLDDAGNLSAESTAPAAIPFQTFYSCSKAAINDFTLALANEVRPYGVTVCAVQPGDIRTGFTDARAKSAEGDDLYGGRISRSVAGMEKDERNGMSPDKAGKKIAAVALKKKSKPLMALGFSYQFLCVLIKLLPVRLVNYLVGVLYAR